MAAALPGSTLPPKCSCEVVEGDLRLGTAERLPWNGATFDAVLRVNALHHFNVPTQAITEASRVLRPGGVFLSFGLDPHTSNDRWYVYDFFPPSPEHERERFPSADARTQWFQAAGFCDISIAVSERVRASMSLPEAERAGILERSSTSQSDVLSDSEYKARPERLAAAAERDPSVRMVADLAIFATVGQKPADAASGMSSASHGLGANPWRSACAQIAAPAIVRWSSAHPPAEKWYYAEWAWLALAAECQRLG